MDGELSEDTRLTGPTKIERAVALAGKVGRPLTFFAAMGFVLVGLIPALYAMTPDDPPLSLAIPLGLVCAALPVDIICVLFWAKAKIAQDSNAFKDE